MKGDKFSGYIKQLDGLRATAILCVLLTHWLGWLPIIKDFPFGLFGVNLFFIISAFLITKIILEGKDRIGKQNFGNVLIFLKSFYVRRSLRIFPIYFITLIVITFFIPQTREHFVWNACYLSNILIMKLDTWDLVFSHFWSLSVEEQFYLIWPLLLLCTPNRFLYAFFGCSFLLGILTRILLSYFDYSYIDAQVFTFACFDSFAAGGFLALAHQKKVLTNLQRLSIYFLSTGIVSLILVHYIQGEAPMIFQRVGFTLIGFALVLNTIVGFKGILRYIFENKLLIYIGQISYGIYLFHPFTAYFVDEYMEIHSGFLKAVINFIVVIIVASITKVLIEDKFNELKRFYPYNNNRIVANKT